MKGGLIMKAPIQNKKPLPLALMEWKKQKKPGTFAIKKQKEGRRHLLNTKK